MRGCLPGLLLIAACYTPAIPSEVPCSPSGECPDGWACAAGTCVLASGSLLDAAVGEDAGGDAISVMDRDGDGVADTADNCPAVANRDQANEDGDKFGDACDPCPPVANNSPSDPDGDGVADSCDPNPTVAGDKIELFEGFHHGLPAWARTANWSATGDSISVAATIDSDEYLIPPVSNPDRVHVSASFFVEQLVGTNIDHEIGLAVPYDASKFSGVGCDLVDDNGRFIGMWDDFQNRQVAQTGFSWSNTTEYGLTMTHQGTSYACTIVEPNGTKHAASGTSGGTTTTPVVAIRAYALTARVAWVMVVRSP